MIFYLIFDIITITLYTLDAIAVLFIYFSNMIIDTHAHLMFKDFNGDVDEVLRRAKGNGVEKIINVGCSVETSAQAIEFAEKYDEFYATLGLHPYDALDATEDLMEKWEVLARENEKIVAIGECGLDYFKSKVSRDDQKKAFRMQLKLAMKTGLPLIIHNRDADNDCFDILEDFEKNEMGGRRLNTVFHCYSSDVRFARKLWYKGYFTSFTGVVTYPNADKVREVVDEMPMDMFMVETDCPFLSPQKFRGERNEPAYVTEVVKKIAEIRDLNVDEVARISTENAKEFFLRMG